MPEGEKIEDGGPAFACASEYGHQEGMSLRDWFAGQALEGLIAYPDEVGTIEEIAVRSYRFADALLAARKAGKP